MDPRIIDAIGRMVAGGNISGAIALFGLGTVIYVFNKTKK